jgi:hypothetical protein
MILTAILWMTSIARFALVLYACFSSKPIIELTIYSAEKNLQSGRTETNQCGVNRLRSVQKYG